MKKVILAAVAAFSLCLPALAQQSAPPASSPQSQSTTASPGDEISPQKLNAQQVRQLQQSLNDKGFSVGAVDSEWGPRTEEALKKFQESKSMPSSGQLNESTISALGLNGSDFGLSHGNSQTTGQAPGGNSNSGQPQENKDTTKAH